MSFITPSTAVNTTGTVTSSLWNSNVRDNLNYLYGQSTALYGSASDYVYTPMNNLGTTVAGTTYTVDYSDLNNMLLIESGTAGTVIIPADSLTSGGTFPVKTNIHIAQLGTGQITVEGMASAVTNGTVTLNATPSASLRTQYSVATIIKLDDNEWLLTGDLA